MTNEQREALWASAEHWLENWQDPETAQIGTAVCACCRNWFENECKGCPIAEHTERVSCYGTPYRGAVEALLDYQLGGRTPSREAQNAIEAEYRFLVQLALGEPPDYTSKKEKF